VAARQHRLADVREEIERPATGTRTRRSRFDHFVELTYQQVSRPPFFLICVAIIIGWLVSLPLWGDTRPGKWLSTPSQVSSRYC
jgi:hypothetical protein